MVNARPQQAPALSVIVGSQNARNSVRECLASLERQTNGREVEIIVVENSTDGTNEIIRAHFPNLRVIRAPVKSLMPELWETGIRLSRAQIVALTTSHFIPRQDWVERILKAHDSPYAGIGGAIENDPRGTWADWAVYFNRYSAFIPPVASGVVNDIAADNASYKRAAIDRRPEIRKDGFWEAMVHDEFKRMGLQLCLDPSIVVSHKRSFTVTGFLKQRFRHGRQFGSVRAIQSPLLKRLAYLALSPAIPCVLVLRISRRVMAKKRYTSRFLLSLPALLLFTLSWSLGEASGYLWIASNALSPHSKDESEC